MTIVLFPYTILWLSLNVAQAFASRHDLRDRRLSGSTRQSAFSSACRPILSGRFPRMKGLSQTKARPRHTVLTSKVSPCNIPPRVYHERFRHPGWTG